MSSEPNQIELDDSVRSSAGPLPCKISQEKDITEIHSSSDIEADEDEKALYRAEKTELTPVEAFTWNVDGDQSPCWYTASVYCLC